MTSVDVPPSSILRHELEALHKHWWCFLLLGATLLVFGTLCIVDPLIGSVASILVLGFIVLAGGIVQIVSSVWAGRWSGMLLHLLMGLLYVIVGFMIIDRPGISMAVLTMFIAAFLIVAGLFRIVSSLVVRFHDWGWVLLNGLVTLILGLIINRQLPESSLWVIGLFVGIELIFNGWAWVMLAFGLRRVGAIN
ncbi:MAG TPA: HdeD family acid-resistance protein [Lacipirellulaceae bacterium]|nr:HdeD family acid-resistance protein [Lacipirellulaceae bacterium]